MKKLVDEILNVLTQFGGGGDDPATDIVRFLLPSVFWSVLVVIALRQWGGRHDRRDLYIAVASLVGLSREVVMFVAEYVGIRGFLPFNVTFRFYPPFEHAFTMLSCLMLGYAFMKYFLPWQKYAQLFFMIGGVIIALLYGIIAPAWKAYLHDHPQTLFGAFWGDMAFRVTASLLMGAVLAFLAFGRSRGIPVPVVLFVAFSFLFLDEFLMIFNLANGERYRTIYAPVRHNLHIWAIPLFLNVYWTEFYERLIKTERVKERMFNLSPSALCVSDSGGVIKMMSPASTRVFGLAPEQLVGRSVNELGFPKGLEGTLFTDRRREDRALVRSFETRHRTPDGIEKYLQWNIQPVYVEGALYSVVTDVTEQMRMREELQKTEKLDSVAILAGGIAHDFNNILTAILGNISVARAKSPRDGAAAERLSVAEKACGRAKDLTRQLLTFTKGGAPVKKVVRLESMLKETGMFSIRGSNIRCSFLISDELRPVEVDDGQISQVIGNLVINAEQAMPDGGTIVISARNMIVTEESAVPLAPGIYVMFSVRDTGVGIPKEDLQKIFDPFFTTKQKGNGLGLASVYSIIKKHNGFIEVLSEPGSGSVFSVYLPACTTLPRDDEHRKEPAPDGAGRVLLVDDEDMVHDTTGPMLKSLGYEFESSRDGADAIARFKKAADSGRPFDAVIMDLTIPGGMGGKDAVRKLLEAYPSTKVIVLSGYSNDDVMARYHEYGFKGFIAKPYELEELGRVLHAVISSATETDNAPGA